METKMFRFDINSKVRDFLSKAIELGTIDATAAFLLGANHRDNHMAAINEVIEKAYSNSHHNASAHKKLSIMADDILATVY